MARKANRIAVVILRREGKVLIAQRSSELEWAPGAWHFPGGSVEEGESVTDAAVREISEELGVLISPADLKLQGVVAYDVDDGEDSDVFYFSTSVWQGEPKIMEPDRCQGLRWVNDGEIPDNSIEHAKLIGTNPLQPNYVYVYNGEVQYNIYGGAE